MFVKFFGCYRNRMSTYLKGDWSDLLTISRFPVLLYTPLYVSKRRRKHLFKIHYLIYLFFLSKWGLWEKLNYSINSCSA